MRKIASFEPMSFLLRATPLLLASALAFDGAAAGEPAADLFRQLPMSFEVNEGQVDPRVRFLSRAKAHALFLTDNAAVLAWRPPASGDEEAGAAGSGVLRMGLEGSNPRARAEGVDLLATRSHYFTGGDPAGWRSNVRHYAKVAYRDVYPGVDLVFHASRRQLEFDFVVAPGARLGDIRMDFEGAESLRLDEDGNLIATTAGGDVVIHAPLVYQSVDGRRVPIDGAFVPREDHRVGFQVASYDADKTLVIDPVLSFSTFLGGGGSEESTESAGIAVDADGMIYTAGRTNSLDFPTVDPFQPGFAGNHDIFVAKLDPFTASIVYATYMGGGGDEGIGGIEVDATGSVYLVGNSTSADFPTLNAVQPIHAGGNDAIAARLDPTGSSLYFATFLGGSGDDQSQGIALDALGNAIFTGFTTSPDFPTQNPVQGANGGGLDAFIAKLNPTGSTLVFSTYHGGSDRELGFDIDTDPAGNVYVSGSTTSADLPLANPFQAVYMGESTMGFGDAFVVKLSGDGATRIYSTYLGGSNDEVGQSIAVDDLGHAHLGGATSSAADFPLVNPLQAVHAGGVMDAFVTKFDPSGTALVYSTFYGGGGADLTHGIEADSLGNVTVTGHTTAANFPVVDAVQSTLGGGTDGFLFTLNALGSAIGYSTYLGGSLEDRGIHLAIDPHRNAYVAGDTESSDYPTANPVQGALAGPFDAVVSKIEMPRPEVLLSLVEDGPQIQANVSLANPDDQEATVDMRIWLESAVVGDPIALVGTQLNLAASMPLTQVISLPLPGILPFPGTQIGARLFDAVDGELLSESLCPVLPCN